MKALLINGSPRPRGCTYTALTELKKTLEAEGIEVELLHVGSKDIRGCIACRKCHETGKCVFDDVVNSEQRERRLRGNTLHSGSCKNHLRFFRYGVGSSV